MPRRGGRRERQSRCWTQAARPAACPLSRTTCAGAGERARDCASSGSASGRTASVRARHRPRPAPPGSRSEAARTTTDAPRYRSSSAATSAADIARPLSEGDGTLDNSGATTPAKGSVGSTIALFATRWRLFKRPPCSCGGPPGVPEQRGARPACRAHPCWAGSVRAAVARYGIRRKGLEDSPDYCPR